jgi:hypothetical protein
LSYSRAQILTPRKQHKKLTSYKLKLMTYRKSSPKEA